MTVQELKNEFLTRYDAATSLAAPGWEDSEISTFLNIAQIRLVTELFNAGNLPLLSNLIHTNSDTAVAMPDVSNGCIADINNIHPTFLFYVGSRTKITRTNPVFTSTFIPNELLTDQRFAWKFYHNPFNKLWLKYPKCYIDYSGSQKSIVVLVDYYTDTPTEIELTAVIKPTDIDIDTNINTNMDLVTHPTIVEYAVEEALKSIKIAKTTNQ